MTPFDLSGQTAFVTGGATGIGEAIARRLAAAGARVVVGDLDIAGAEAVAASLPEGLAVTLDVTEAASARAAIAAAVAHTGRLDILVNNAGVTGPAAPLWEVEEDDWHRVLRVNLDGVFHMARAVLPAMRAAHYGRIVNIASVAGKEGNPNMSAYSASKAAVIALTKSLGKELALDGICVNAVAPAVVRTRILEQLTPDQVDYMTARIPMRRTGDPDEIAAVVHFLASRDASFVTGQCYDASGGRATY